MPKVIFTKNLSQKIWSSRTILIFYVCSRVKTIFKNDSGQLKNFIVLNLPPFSLSYTVREKGGKFKTRKFVNYPESLLYCLYSNSFALKKRPFHFSTFYVVQKSLLRSEAIDRSGFHSQQQTYFSFTVYFQCACYLACS